MTRFPLAPALLIALAADLAAAAIMLPSDNAPVSPPASARFSASVLHTRGSNQLQAQLDSIGACQFLRVDSVRVLDKPLDTGLVVTFLDAPPQRDLRVWWSLWQNPSDASCASARSSRHMLDLPVPFVRPGSDTLLRTWAPGRIEAIGPGGLRDTVIPERFNQAGVYDYEFCPMVDYWCGHFETDSGLTGEQILARTIQDQLQAGRPVVRIARAGALRRSLVTLGSSNVEPLGPALPWGRGNQAWAEDLPLRSARTWGSVPAPTEWSLPTGRRFYLWRNSPSPRCGDVDTLCPVDPERALVTTTGSDHLVSNDSTAYCSYFHPLDPRADTDLANDWLVLPDSVESRTGTFRRTLTPSPCGGRVNAWPIRNDSVLYGGTAVALASLDRVVGVSRRAGVADFGCRATPHGLILRTGFSPGETWTARVRDLSGRILSTSTSRSPELALAFGAHGAFLVEIRSAQGSRVRSIVR